MRRTLANYDNHYKKSKVHVEEMEEDKEHVIIVNPCGAEINSQGRHFLSGYVSCKSSRRVKLCNKPEP